DDAKRAPRRISAPLLHGRHYYIVAGPDGGSYLFAWNVPPKMQTAHVTLLLLLLLLMTGVVFIAHTVLTRLLRALRGLSEGVARLGAGELDVVLPLEHATNPASSRTRSIRWWVESAT